MTIEQPRRYAVRMPYSIVFAIVALVVFTGPAAALQTIGAPRSVVIDERTTRAVYGDGVLLAVAADMTVVRSIDGGSTWLTGPAIDASPSATISGMSLATNGAGVFVAVWPHLSSSVPNPPDEDLWVARSTDGGATWSTATTLNTDAATDDLHDRSSTIVWDDAGHWVTAWVRDDGLYTSRSDDGLTWTAPALLFPTSSVASLASNGAGTVVAAWVVESVPPFPNGTDDDVYTARSVDGGLTWSAPAPLFPDVATESRHESQVAIANDRAGGWIAVATMPRISGEYTVPVISRSIDDATTWSVPEPLDGLPAVEGEPSVTLATDGTTWALGYRAISPLLGLDPEGSIGAPAVVRSTDGGATWSIPTQFHQYRSFSDQPAEVLYASDLGWRMFNATENDFMSIADGAMPCAPNARVACRQTSKARLRVQRYANASRNTFDWTWRGDATSVPDFGSPTSTTGYALCLYDATDNVAFAAAIPAGGTCGAKPCWKAKASGYLYTTTSAGDPHGVRKLQLKAGAAGRAQVTVTSKSNRLVLPVIAGPPLGLPWRVQLQTDATCWETTFEAADVRTGSQGKLLAAVP